LLIAGLSAVAATVLLGCNRAPEAEPVAQTPSTSLGTQVDDSVITARVKSALLADATVSGMDVQVETRAGTVLLSGFVDNQSQIDQALAITRRVEGVGNVDNGITVKSASGSMGTVVDDTAVTGRVKAALLADADIRSLDISVKTVQGEVQLSGFVDNQGQIDRAAEVARSAEGAGSVKNELRVKP
jgi:hyperosmotically inducible protein